MPERRRRRAEANPAEAAREPNGFGPTVFASLQPRLCLKLESRKGPVDLAAAGSGKNVPAGN
jgi:hypothetical protein